MTTVVIGKAEPKSLAQQIDRLDATLDGLADGLNEAVADAVKQAVALAVEAALRELLASAELQRRLHPDPAPQPGLVRRAAAARGRGVASTARGCWSCAGTLAGQSRAKTTAAVAALREGRAVMVGRARRGLAAFTRRMWLAGLVAAGCCGDAASRCWWRRPRARRCGWLATWPGRPCRPWSTAWPPSSAR
jgi:hypothetical protein